MYTAPRQVSFGSHRAPISDTVQPTRHRSALANRFRPASQHEKGRLKGIVGVMPVLENMMAHSLHHGTVSPNDFRKRILIVALGKAL
jgi:hypothetical protein